MEKFRCFYDRFSEDPESHDEIQEVEASSPEAAAREYALDQDDGAMEETPVYMVDEKGSRHAFNVRFERVTNTRIKRLRWT